MTREEKIDFLNGVANGSRSIDELIQTVEPSIDYSLLTSAEKYYLFLPRKNHSRLYSNKILSKSLFWNIVRSDLPKRQRCEKSKRGFLNRIMVDRIYYHDELNVPAFIDITYNTSDNKCICLFHDDDAAESVKELLTKSDELLEAELKRITEDLPENTEKYFSE